MKLRTLSEIATVGGFVIAFYVFAFGDQDVIDSLPKEIQSEANSDVEKLNVSSAEDREEKEVSHAEGMIQAALLMTSTTQRNEALSAAVALALASNEFKVALVAIEKMTSSTLRNSSLRAIASEAVRDKKYIGYATVAAERATSSVTRNEILDLVVDAYSSFNNEGSNGSKARDALYKQVFAFADSVKGLYLTKEEAAAFAENWVASRDEQQFKLFKEVYFFADSSSGLYLPRYRAEKFALEFVDSYGREGFDRFQDLFRFANSSSGMNLTREKALEHAMERLTEQKGSQG